MDSRKKNWDSLANIIRAIIEYLFSLLCMRTNNISNKMMGIGKMGIGEENRNRELHGQYHHSTPTFHSPRPSMLKLHSGNSFSLL